MLTMTSVAHLIPANLKGPPVNMLWEYPELRSIFQCDSEASGRPQCNPAEKIGADFNSQH